MFEVPALLAFLPNLTNLNCGSPYIKVITRDLLSQVVNGKLSIVVPDQYGAILVAPTKKAITEVDGIYLRSYISSFDTAVKQLATKLSKGKAKYESSILLCSVSILVPTEDI